MKPFFAEMASQADQYIIYKSIRQEPQLWAFNALHFLVAFSSFLFLLITMWYLYYEDNVMRLYASQSMTQNLHATPFPTSIFNKFVLLFLSTDQKNQKKKALYSQNDTNTFHFLLSFSLKSHIFKKHPKTLWFYSKKLRAFNL